MLTLHIEAETFTEFCEKLSNILVEIGANKEAALLRTPKQQPSKEEDLSSSTTTSSTIGKEESEIATTKKRHRRTKAQIEADKEKLKPVSPESEWEGESNEELETNDSPEIEAAPPIAENKAVTLEDCKALVRKIIGPDEKGIPAAANLNLSFGIRKVVDLADKPESWGKFYAAGMKVLNELQN